MQRLIILTLLKLLGAYCSSFLKIPEPDQSNSLARLLHRLALDYLSSCSLSVIYDSSRENWPTDNVLQSFVSDTSLLTFTQERINASQSKRTEIKSSQPCKHYVIFLNDMSNLERLMSRNADSKIVVATSQTPWEVKEFLKSHTSRAYVNLLAIVRSTSKRTSARGSYLLYTHKLYSEGSGSTEPVLLASWIKNELSLKDVDLFPEKLRGGYMGHRLLTSVVENPPFTVRKSISGTDDYKWDGLEIRLMHLAAEHLNFTVEFAGPRSSGINPIESAKNDLLSGISTVAFGGIYQTSNIADTFEATTPHVDDCAVFISLASTALPKYRAVLGPFQLSVWIFLVLSYIVLIIPLSFNSNYTVLSLIKHPRGLNHMFWFVFSYYTNSFVVKSPLLDYGLAKNSISILLAIYWVYTIIVTACYTSSIISFILLPAYPVAMESAKDLLANRYRIGTLDHNGWEQWFNVNTTDDAFVKRLFRKMEYVPSIIEGVQNASRAYFWPYAFLASKTSLDYIIQTDFAPTWTTKRSLMHISRECFVRYNVVQLYPAKSLYAQSMNKFVYRATEAGLIDKIVNDIEWEIQRNAVTMNKQITKRMSQKVRVEERILTVEDTAGMFLLLGIGFLLGLIALGCESLVRFLKHWKTGKNHPDNSSSEFDVSSACRQASFLQHRRVSNRKSL